MNWAQALAKHPGESQGESGKIPSLVEKSSLNLCNTSVVTRSLTLRRELLLRIAWIRPVHGVLHDLQRNFLFENRVGLVPGTKVEDLSLAYRPRATARERIAGVPVFFKDNGV